MFSTLRNFFKKKNVTCVEEKNIEQEFNKETTQVLKTKLVSVVVNFQSQTKFISFVDHYANDEKLHDLCFEDAYLLMKQMERCMWYNKHSPFKTGPFFDQVLHYNYLQDTRTRISCINYTDGQLLLIQQETWKNKKWNSEMTRRIKFYDDDVTLLLNFLQTSFASCSMHMFKHLINFWNL